MIVVYKAEVVAHARKGLALSRSSHPGEIVLSGSHRLRYTLVAAPFLFAHDVFPETGIGRIITPALLYLVAQDAHVLPQGT